MTPEQVREAVTAEQVEERLDEIRQLARSLVLERDHRQRVGLFQGYAADLAVGCLDLLSIVDATWITLADQWVDFWNEPAANLTGPEQRLRDVFLALSPAASPDEGEKDA